MRVGVRGSGDCALSFYLGIQKEAIEGDTMFQYSDITVYMDQISIEKLDQIELDYLENHIKTGFVFRDVNKDGIKDPE